MERDRSGINYILTPTEARILDIDYDKQRDMFALWPISEAAALLVRAETVLQAAQSIDVTAHPAGGVRTHLMIEKQLHHDVAQRVKQVTAPDLPSVAEQAEAFLADLN